MRAQDLEELGLLELETEGLDGYFEFVVIDPVVVVLVKELELKNLRAGGGRRGRE